MNAKQKKVLESFARVRVFVDAHPATGRLDYVHARAMLDDALALARAYAATQEGAPTMSRAAVRRQEDLVAIIKDSHMRQIVTIARAQSGPGSDVGLAALRMPAHKLGLQGMLAACDGMIETVRPHADVFVSHDMPADFLDRFTRARDALARSMSVRAALTNAHVAARHGLKVQLRRARLAVDRLDAVLRAVFFRDEAVLTTWRTVKRIHRLTGGAAMPSQRRGGPDAFEERSSPEERRAA